MNKSEEKKILKYAQDLFAKYGLHKTSIDEIAKNSKLCRRLEATKYL